MGKSSRTRYWQKLRNDIFRDRWLYLLILPGIVWYLIYRYLPMAGLSLAFHEYLDFIREFAHRLMYCT